MGGLSRDAPGYGGDRRVVHGVAGGKGKRRCVSCFVSSVLSACSRLRGVEPITRFARAIV